MAFLFKSKKHQSNAPQPQQKPPPNPTNPANPDLSSSASSIPTANGSTVSRSLEKDRPSTAQTPATSATGSVNNSMNSIAGGGTSSPSPEQKTIRDRADSDLQQTSRAMIGPSISSSLANPPNSSLYPWSQRKLSFTTSQPQPFPRYGAATNTNASKEGDIYLMGGLINGSTVKGDLWLVEAGMPYNCYPITVEGDAPGPRVGHASLLVGNAFIVYGGDTKMDERDLLDDTLWLLNTTTKQWSRASPPGKKPSGRYGHTLNIIGSKIYIFGGQVEGFFFNDLVAFDLNALQSPQNRWEFLIPNSAHSSTGIARVPPARTNHTVVHLNEKLYLFGGTNGITWFNDVWCYEPRTNMWSQLDCIGYIPAPREGHAAALVGDIMYIFGGRTEQGTDLGDLAAFRISTRRWYTFQNMGPSPSPRSGHSMTAYNKEIVILGGEPSVAGGDPSELSLVYVLDTGKIRYKNDQPNTQSQQQYAVDRSAPGIRRPSGGEKPPITQNRAPPVRDGPAQPAKQLGPQTYGPARENGTNGTSNFARPLDSPNQIQPGPASRLPRAGLSQAPSGPPPQQQAPPPRMNGVAPNQPGQRVKPPAAKVDRGFGANESAKAAVGSDKENTSPSSHESPTARDSPLANGRRTPTQVPTPISSKIGQRPREASDAEATGSLRSRSRQARQQGSIDSMNDSTYQSRSMTPNEGSIPTQAELQKKTSTSRLQSDAQHEYLTKELQAVKGQNAWYASELALARKAGYSFTSTNGPIPDEKATDGLGDNEKPLIEALLAMRSELGRVQADVESQTASTAKQIAEVEKQRDAAISEAVYAKAKLAAHGGSNSSTPQLDHSARDISSLDNDRSTELNRKLAASLSGHKDLQARIESLTHELNAEKQARLHAEDTAKSAHARILDLDAYKQKNALEVERLKSELHEASKAARDDAARNAEISTSTRMLQLDKEELSTRLEEALGASKNHSSVLLALRAAVTASSDKSAMLERKLEEEKAQRSDLENTLSQLRGKHEERTAELEATSRKLRDAEELAEKHSHEARTHREAVLNGLTQSSSRDVNGFSSSAADERVQLLKAQVEQANASSRKCQKAADEAAEKLRTAEERIAGLESYQEQSSRDGMNVRKQLQTTLRDLQALSVEHNETKQKLSNHQLESRSMEIQHGALRDLLGERGINADGRRSRNNASPGSGFGTPDHPRLRELEQQLQSSHKAHDDTKASFENREREAEQQYREKIEQLEGDFTQAVHYIKRTEKMLKGIQGDLAKHKGDNIKLQEQLAEYRARNAALQEKADASNSAGSLDAPAEWESERTGLKKEVDELQAKVKRSVAELEQKVSSVRSELKTVQDERNHFKTTSLDHETRLAEFTHRAAADVEQLKHENALLEARAADAEDKVTTYLNQMEASVDNQRRRSRAVGTESNGEHTGHQRVPSTGHDSITADSDYGPDNRTSLALDNLASELDALRSHWETNSKNRLSTQFDFDKGLASPGTGELSHSLADWRRRLDDEEAAAAAGGPGGSLRALEIDRSEKTASKTGLSHTPAVETSLHSKQQNVI
ncbi:MAG: Negative regulator of mitotic exit [Vezdaea aestivalis]|nr:MAG: Negative regulator of mitotic exit [Vezdaea aestivalis]